MISGRLPPAVLRPLAAPAAEGRRGAPLRYDGLDVVRAAAMLLGVAYHATYAYVPDIGHWYIVQDGATHPFFAVLGSALHAFRMQVFFALAGFFAHLVLERRGPQAFLGDRFRRLMVPFLVGAPLLLGADWALRAWAGHWGVMRDDYIGRAGWFRPQHLWFLEYLFFFVLATWALVKIGGLGRAAERAFAAVLRVPELFLALSALTALGLHTLGEPRAAFSFLPEPASVAHYLPFFLFGWLLWACRLQLGALSRCGWLLGPGLMLAFYVYSRELQWQLEGQVLGALSAWLVTLGSLSLAFWVPQRERPTLMAAVAASYWVYLVHLPLVVAGQIVMTRFDWPAGLKYAVVVAAATGFSFLSFSVIVRRTFLAPWLGVRRLGAAVGSSR